ncbi:pyruvate dehydrogenase E2 component (dihydrolipoamide acetyltransferase) [Silvimonas terrae]|uniref:Acetyltransferase component of pyruvate dehydrogenase complex n=1 Tax=Silvimonas terrae TaxID=300266 RepID=A0A840RJU9_9NEIS|nr:dihydrolipoyllysine-residue acetyltransferase [Silvimonas terrae]MBB5192522.1 pyruvate dehydrogenase E2 component (dihydrolipoamide acetyltransferase) [Silvimonas terrae]
MIELKIPDIGGHDGVDVIEVMVKPGDVVEKEQSLITLETDKATMEVPATEAGVVKEVKVKVGDKVSEGDVIVLIEASGAAAPAPAAAAPAPAPAPAPQAAPAPVAAPATAQSIEVHVPDIGNFDAVEIIEINVKVGDTVSVDDSLITLESDKASMEVPSTAAGVVESIAVKVGEKVGQGALILTITGSAAGAAPAPVAAPAPAPQAAPAPAPAVAAPAPAPVASASVKFDEEGFRKAHASPSVRSFARDLGVDLSKVKGTGPKGRILHEDVRGYVKNVLSGAVAAPAAAAPAGGSGVGLDLLPWPKVDFAKFGPIETRPLSRIQKISGANLSRNWVMIPHVTFNDEADITELEEFRKSIGKEWEKSGLKLSPLAFIIKAAAEALKAFPNFNSSLDGDNLVLKQYYHIGFAADTPNGLVVPVIKDVDKKGLKQIAQELTDLSALAREGKLKPTDMQGATFTISSLGGIGGSSFTPIINAPEVAILGVCKSQIKPVWDGSQFAPRLLCPLSLSFDHRVIDGAAAARFTVYLGKLLTDIRRLVL